MKSDARSVLRESDISTDFACGSMFYLAEDLVNSGGDCRHHSVIDVIGEMPPPCSVAAKLRTPPTIRPSSKQSHVALKQMS